MINPNLDPNGLWIGRVNIPSIGPAVVTLRSKQLVDITAPEAATVSDVLEREDTVDYVRNAPGKSLGKIEDCRDWLAPCDLQAIKACGVTFASSMVERVIEEQAAGDASKAVAIREKIAQRIGSSLDNIRPGSEAAERAKTALISEGLWSQYLEVGIGPDAEVFSKAQSLSSVGFGDQVGLHPKSNWNNPEPEVVLAISSQGEIKGATLGNDVNLRDFEGRSALLLSKAKDNNASCAIGPMIRLFDKTFTLDDVRTADVMLRVEGEDGFILNGLSSMSQISRDPTDLVKQTIGRHHQYPDGLMLFMGTLFAPTEDRDEPGNGFTHKLGDVVTISSPCLGQLSNTVQLSTQCPEWTFGISAFMRNLASRGLI